MKFDQIKTHSVRALLALALAMPVGACSNPVGEDEDHNEASGLVVENTQGTVLASVNASRAVTGSISVRNGQEQEIRVFFLDADGDRIALDGDEFALQGTVANSAVASWTKGGEDRGRIRGASVGSTTLVFDMTHGGHPDYSAPAIPVNVTQ